MKTFLALVATLALAGCGDTSSEAAPLELAPDGTGDTGGGDTGDTGGTGGTGDTGQPAVVSDRFSVRGTIEQIYVWAADPGAAIEVEAPDGEIIAGNADDLGSLVMRGIEPGDGYIVRLADEPDERTEDVSVLSKEGSLPDEAFYSGQDLQPGYGYITMRDGTQLSIFVSLPGPPEDGPYPTIVNYSGYSPSKPGESLGAEVEVFCGSFPILCDAPGHPSGLLAGIAGYASVGVNMRGTGCSGGAYDFFEPLQLTDGYDIIEIVARQGWVKHNKVGMAGLSYPGISQLFVAQTQPPSLAAITPMSVLADSASSTLAPGGIYNTGFALSWIDNVLDRAEPYGHAWITKLVEEGDALCEDNQLLHSAKVDVVAKALANPYYTDEVARPVDPSAWVDKINVPVFLSGQWQDEQTGPHFAALLDKFTGSPHVSFVVGNGVHVDGFTPQVMLDWKIFLDLYVAREVPTISEDLRLMTTLFMQSSTGVALELGENPYADHTSYEVALAEYEAVPPLRVIFETGAAADMVIGAPVGSFEERFEAWPIPSTQARRWYFHADGTLGDGVPTDETAASVFNHDPEAGDRTTLDGSVSDLQPNYHYEPLIEGKAVAFETSVLETNHVMIGHGSVDLFVSSTADDADLEVNLTEVRPDGMEIYVQSGWLRASHRGLRADATELRPVKTHREKDNEPLILGEWHEVRVEIMPFAHVFRAGSRIRISVDTPGDSRADWRFLLLPHDDEVQHTIGHDVTYPSSVVLPLIPDIAVPTEAPAECTALRGQPCRAYVSLENTPADG